MAILSTITVARFWSKVDVTVDARECWLWKGATTGNGYGNFSVQELSTKMPAHRVAHWIASGDFPPEGMVVRHSCDTPLCVNPKHLILGTQSENMHDAYSRGRRGAHKDM